ncbi:MAG: ATPase/DNA packaging protein [Candidatus Helarchaeota archaeon]
MKSNIEIIDGFDYESWFIENENFSMIIAGQRRSGKSTLLKWLIKNHFTKIFDKNNIILVKDSDYDEEGYNSYVNKENIVDFDVDLVFHLVAKQKELKRKNKSEKIIIIFDDCMSKSKLRSSIITEKLEELFFNGRHMDISFVFSTQYIAVIPSGWVANADMTIAKNVISENFCESIRRNFASHVTKTQFIRHLKKIYEEDKYINVIFDNVSHKIHKDVKRLKIVRKVKVKKEEEDNEIIEEYKKEKEAEKKNGIIY